MNMKNVSSSEITICGHTYDEYIDMVKAFHSHVAPGMVFGGFMVDLAYRNCPQGEFFDAICETTACLPDAILDPVKLQPLHVFLGRNEADESSRGNPFLEMAACP